MTEPPKNIDRRPLRYRVKSGLVFALTILLYPFAVAINWISGDRKND